MTGALGLADTGLTGKVEDSAEIKTKLSSVSKKRNSQKYDYE